MATNSEMINVMELSLPSSTNSSRPETPTITNCERQRAINKDIEKFGIVIESIKSSLRGLQIAGIDDVNDPTFLDQTRRLDDYQRLQQLAVSEFTSQPYCNTPGCITHSTPTNSPTKINVKRQDLTKNTTTKRKDKEEDFTSPSNRQTRKTRRTISQEENNFKIDLQNKFDNLKLDTIAGSASTDTHNSQTTNPKIKAKTNNNNTRFNPTNNNARKNSPNNTQTLTIGNKPYLPPPERPLPLAYSGTANREVAHLVPSTNRIARYQLTALKNLQRLFSSDECVIPCLLPTTPSILLSPIR
ncbi:hypothetical protein TNIN_70781 [Trichonephila inaurata madagascariensis]|uniref:Uncharacterized protein n=1 Tax=Trichonephila inaurata madagascariensis TaxID=2747483 RepID=A0A8X7C4P1_9ARAC|nr:hypothetical protein TNIN_70781 [Trichonephila inaurata madagascariensis]